MMNMYSVNRTINSSSGSTYVHKATILNALSNILLYIYIPGYWVLC